MIVKLLTADPTPKAHHNDTFPSRLAGGLRGRILQPRSLTDRIFAALCPWSAGQAGWSVSTCEDDLLCTNAQTPRKAKDTEAAQRLVYLRLETHNATEAKVGLLRTRAASDLMKCPVTKLISTWKWLRLALCDLWAESCGAARCSASDLATGCRSITVVKAPERAAQK